MLKVWDKFEWDDDNKKNGNVQHLREHDIEPEEAEGCFFHEIETQNKQEKKMKKQVGKLANAEREKIEAQYHRMNPADFEERMSQAKRHSPGALRLPAKLVETLKMVAESEGEREYQAMVKRWIEERLRQETSSSR